MRKEELSFILGAGGDDRDDAGDHDDGGDDHDDGGDDHDDGGDDDGDGGDGVNFHFVIGQLNRSGAFL